MLILFVYFTIISIINNFLLFPFLLLSKKLNSKLYLYIGNIYLFGLSFIIKYFHNSKLYIKNKHLFDENINKLIIQNHQSEFDYFFGYMLFFINNLSFNLKMIISYHVYYILPGIGLYNILLDAILIKFNKTDLNRLDKLKIKDNDIVYLYPEGYVIHKKTKEKSDNYCLKNNIEKTKNVLYPKTTGLNIITKNNNIKDIYVLCTHYSDFLPNDINHKIFTTQIPKKIYIDIQKYEINDIKETTVQIFRNIDKSFNNKNYDDYKLINLTLKEFLCFLFNIILFIFGIYLLYNYHIVKFYFLIQFILYYVYLYFFI